MYLSTEFSPELISEADKYALDWEHTGTLHYKFLVKNLSSQMPFIYENFRYIGLIEIILSFPGSSFDLVITCIFEAFYAFRAYRIYWNNIRGY